MVNRVLLYNSGGGVGDALQTLPLINTLKKEFKNKINIINEDILKINEKNLSIDIVTKFFGVICCLLNLLFNNLGFLF